MPVIFQGHEYKLFTDAKSWNAAQAACAALGGHLVTIESPEENAFVRQLAGGAVVWIGFTDSAVWGATEGDWELITGEILIPNVDYDNWQGNYYSTVRYWVLENGVEKQLEYPPEIYYWYIVQPAVNPSD